ncbi:MAG: class I SAM-dependent methyltransferase [Candidatus Woesearchaeota archaeon]
MGKLGFFLINLRYGIKHAFDWVEYARYLEYPLVFEKLGLANAGSSCKFLDVGSGRFGKFALYVALHTKCAIHSTDVGDYVFQQKNAFRRFGLGSALGSCIMIEQQDATRMSFASAQFDRISCISVVEHIVGDGDIKAVKEMARVLKKGGRLVITVPYNPLKTGEESYVFADKLYERTSRSGRIFLAKTYDDDTLTGRIIKPSGLSVKSITYFGEPGFPWSRLIYDNNSYLVKLLTKPLGILTPLFTFFFFREMPKSKFHNNDWQGVGACIVLEKR